MRPSTAAHRPDATDTAERRRRSRFQSAVELLVALRDLTKGGIAVPIG